MWTYRPPLRDMQFVIEEVLGSPAGWSALPAMAEFDAATLRHVLEEAGKFVSGVIAPLNATGDRHGCTLVDGEVRTPPGFRDAYAAFVARGWGALGCDPADGGQGLPTLATAAFYEMTAAANHAWVMYPGILHGAYDTLRTHGTPQIKARYLPKLVTGEWVATMHLSEPDAGSDLGRLRTRAEPQADGTYRISGNKVFISAGDNDLAENIVHLILARLPDAPPGTKGLSLFVTTKFLPDGTRNALRCVGIESKMGIKASATCAMSYEGAVAELVGQPNRGLAAMFVMMNSARLHVAMQGIGHLEMAQQNAHAYAHERVQGHNRPIAEHPAVRRILWTQRAIVEGERVIAYRIADLLDRAHHHPEAAERARADALVSILTPVAKAFFTDNGHRGADEALQVWGGYGFVHDYGIEQTVRDSRIAMIYEGTNEIQAIDLVQRKVLDDKGERLAQLLASLEADAAGTPAALAFHAEALARQIDATRAATAALVAGAADDADWPLRVADDYLRGFGFMLLAWAWLRRARAAHPHAGDPWYDETLRAARFGVEWLLPEAAWRWQRVHRRDASLPPAARAGTH